MFDCLARNAPPPLKNVMLMPKLRAYWTKNCNNLGRNTPRCWLFIVSIPLIPFRSDTQVLNFPAWTITDLENGILKCFRTLWSKIFFAAPFAPQNRPNFIILVQKCVIFRKFSAPPAPKTCHLSILGTPLWPGTPYRIPGMSGTAIVFWSKLP